MKKSRVLIFLLLLMVSPLMFSLDIYLNDILWHSYSSSDLREIRMELSADDQMMQGIPLLEILPLLSGLDGLEIAIPDGEIQLKSSLHTLRKARLLSPDPDDSTGSWQLNLNNSIYDSPRKIELYGTLFPRKELILWAEPGLYGLEKQIQVWSSLHKVRVDYREVRNIRDELIFTEMTGDLKPDFLLIIQSYDQPCTEEETLGFLLQSALVPVRSEGIDTLVLPSGNSLHPDLFLSILASLSDRISPHDPGFLRDSESLNRAAMIYFNHLLDHRFLEQDDFSLSETYRNRNIGYFPARSFPQQSGTPAGLPHLKGMEYPLSSRVLPLKLEVMGDGIPPGTLLDFLKQPGIQYNLLSVPHRQLPADTASLEQRELTESEKQLYSDWKRGFILSEKNKTFSTAVLRRLPDLFRADGDYLP